MIKDDLQQMVVIHEDTHSHFAPLDTLQPVVVSDTNTTHSRIASIKRRTEEEKMEKTSNNRQNYTNLFMIT